MTAMENGSVTSWLESRQGEMKTLLADLVNIDSGSHDKSGVDAVGARFAAFFAGHGIPVSYTRAPEAGDIQHIGSQGDGVFLLTGHRDTVFPAGEAARRPFRIDGTRAYGPGVADMKAGLVMHAFVLAAFARLRPELPVAALFTGDEEVGSRFSRPHIEAAARKARAVFNAEPGRASGNIVGQRKGGLFFRFDTFGKAAHSGANITDGASAIEALARIVLDLHALSRPDEGITVNVGLVSGGQSANTVAPRASGDIDTRYVTVEQRGTILAAIEDIMRRPHLPGTRATYELKSEFLPLQDSAGSRALVAAYLETARDTGLSIEAEFTGGCADSGFISAAGAPVVCGVGPVGGKAHTVEEYIEVDSLLERALIEARTIERLAAR
nr:M20 family metallopeptidase [Aureimonas mangrovi]